VRPRPSRLMIHFLCYQVYYVQMRKGRLSGHGIDWFIHVTSKGWENRELSNGFSGHD
jgi:hypothetical protein